MNKSFDAEFNALPDSLILIEKTDLENWKKKDGMFQIQRQFLILEIFFKIKILWKNRLNRSFDVEFNALPNYGIIIEKIDLENWGKKDGLLNIQREFFIFDEFLCELKPIAKRYSLHHSIENSMLEKNI